MAEVIPNPKNGTVQVNDTTLNAENLGAVLDEAEDERGHVVNTVSEKFGVRIVGDGWEDGEFIITKEDEYVGRTMVGQIRDAIDEATNDDTYTKSVEELEAHFNEKFSQFMRCEVVDTRGMGNSNHNVAIVIDGEISAGGVGGEEDGLFEGYELQYIDPSWNTGAYDTDFDYAHPMAFFFNVNE